MKHILGMAKSPLKLKSGQARSLELDFLRLAYVIQNLNENGDTAQGYLLVLKEKIAQTVERWIEKYKTIDTVLLIVGDLNEREERELEKEKEGNRNGNTNRDQKILHTNISDSSIGRRIGETKLREEIQNREPKIIEICETWKMPYNVHWDFYGVVK